MHWKYDSLVQEHQLVYNKSVLARIQSAPLKHGGLRVSTLISGIYFGMQKQLRLEKQNKEWVCHRRKFQQKDSANLYIRRKKENVQRFIKAREKEG